MNCEYLKKDNTGTYLKNDISAANDSAALQIFECRVSLFCSPPAISIDLWKQIRMATYDDFANIVTRATNRSIFGRATFYSGDSNDSCNSE